MTQARSHALSQFLHTAGWGGAERRLLAGDASFRTYYRLHQPGSRTQAVLMDAPPPQEDIRPFVRIARHLHGLDLSAPAILAEDADSGFLLLEDFGDATYTRLLAAGEPTEADLYALATDVLVELHRAPPPEGLAPYDEARLLAEAALLPDWFLPAVGVTLDETSRAAWDEAWQQVLRPAVLDPQTPPVLVLRDYHVDNLMLLPGRSGVAACGLLDFQDALAGHPAYDLMSLLEDARRNVGPALASAMTTRYLTATGLEAEPFYTAWVALAAQRHAKVIGIFTRLFKRDGKAPYLAHLPHVWRLFHHALRDPALAPVAAWMERHVPHEVRQRVPQ